jgi:DnaJ family protein C protein 19
MGPVLAGAALLVLLLLLLKGYTSSDVKKLAKGFRFSGGLVLALLAVVLGLTGRIGFAFISAGMAWVLLFRSVPPWSRPDYGLGGGARTGSSNAPPPGGNGMTRAEALKVLGLEEGAGENDIRSAHRRLIQQTHPDKGGTTYLAAKINEAKDVLLKR